MRCNASILINLSTSKRGVDIKLLKIVNFVTERFFISHLSDYKNTLSGFIQSVDVSHASGGRC